MNVKIFILIVMALFIRCSLFAQNEQLPVIKSNSVKIDIKFDDVLREQYWTIMPELELDVLKTSAKKVTFYTDIDSISFAVNPQEKYDFIILLNEKDSARTQITYKRQSRNVKECLSNSFDVFTIISTNKPENFNPRAVNQSFRHSISYMIPFGKTNFSLGIGGGISFNNYHIDALPKDVLPASMQPVEYGFVKIASISEPKIKYKKNKITLTYLDIPIELRYFGKKGFKLSAGAKIDFLVNSRFKYKGSDYIFDFDDDIKIKKYHLKHLSNVQIGPIVRAGWKMLNVYATYSFTPVYDNDKLNPICIGISFTPLY